jgi:exodeoxyribonuclease-3
MKILSWNVNWIRAVIQKWFFDWVKGNDADIICLQEVKAFEIQIPAEIRFHLSDYNYLWHKWTRPGYAWTAIFFRKWIEIVEKKSDFPFHEFSDEGRVTEIVFKHWEDVVHLLNVYFPNGWDRADWTEMLSYKLDFYEKMRQYVQWIRDNGEQVIICGDFNICHTEIDIARPKENENSIWFLPVERAEMDKLEDDWLIDVFRKLNPDLRDQYTWWSYRGWARERNVGRRLDYFRISPNMFGYIEKMEHQINVIWSDHCPIGLDLN